MLTSSCLSLLILPFEFFSQLKAFVPILSEIVVSNYSSNRKILKFDKKYIIMNCSCEFLATQILYPCKNNTLIKIPVLNVLYYCHLVLGGVVMKFLPFEKTVLSKYILMLVKYLPLSEMAVLSENKLDYVR